MVTYSANSAARVSDAVRDTSECATEDTCDSERGRGTAAVAVVAAVGVVESSAS